MATVSRVLLPSPLTLLILRRNVTAKADIRPSDVAFEVDSVDAVFQQLVERGGASVVEPPFDAHDEGGKVRMATVRTFGDTTHTLVERGRYSGVFLPGYKAVPTRDHLLSKKLQLPDVELEVIDHCVGNQDWNEMEDACD